jgi:hypothetical protein
MRRIDWQENQTPVSVCCNIRIYHRQTSLSGFGNFSRVVKAFCVAITIPQVLVPPLVGMLVSKVSLFLPACIAFQPLSPKYLIINIDYLVNIATNICWKKLAVQLEVNVGESLPLGRTELS